MEKKGRAIKDKRYEISTRKKEKPNVWFGERAYRERKPRK